ncbi:ABC transporter substrate-binding protein [Chitinasiproducens palmae]|uniref:Branched-chain amino acid transport system substrate-binding protein n=1 Tax=Chitinasiproducens palmae TaxID=1770053 RepID=A0A1H2PR53_9BURK|nr:ABC transporter substrate-binding protein [Chitinasiproducens palmae]SDV48945.1 branched-chain amino acid transport system substrate-binding protein [Chitinasiproducens palmae]
MQRMLSRLRTTPLAAVARRAALVGSALAAACALGGFSTVASAAEAAAPYRLGYLVDGSGPQQTTIKPAYDAFRVYIDALNKRGGVNGRQVEILSRDVRSDTQRSLDAVQELSREKVIGLLGLAATNTHASVYTAARRANLPVLAGYPVNIPLVLPPARPGAFGVGQELSLAGTIGGHFARQVSPKGKSTVCVAFEVPGSILSCERINQQAKALGFEKATILTVPITQRDFRAIVDKIVAERPDVVTDCLGQGHVAALLPVLATSAYGGIFLSMDTGVDNATLRDATPAQSKLTVYSYGRFISGDDGSGAQVAALRDALKAAKVPELTSSWAGGWTLGRVVADALGRCTGECGPADFQKALEHVDIDAGGLTGTRIQLTQQDHYGPSAYRLYRFDNRTRAFAPVGDWLRISSAGRIGG